MTFTSLLVSNRGEIARRVLRAARESGLRTVAVYVDADAHAPFVRDADEAILLPTSYLDATAIVAAALSSGAEAVHPGYGFLSENADFATEVLAAGLTWVGPPPRVIADVGDKLAAKTFALAAGVPALLSSENPRDANDIGYPLMVKAAAGGGGKGMRVVTSPRNSTTPSMRRGEKRWLASRTIVCFLSATSNDLVTSRSRFSGINTARWCTWVSATARSSVDIKNSSRSRPHRRLIGRGVRPWPRPHSRWRARLDTSQPGRLSSWFTTRPATFTSWR